ncbi:MAG: hypothetical protein RLZZ136_1679 [Pseudomonadota bacterium]
MALASTSVYSLGIFMAPLEAEFGWSRAGIAAGLTINTVLAVITSPFIGIAFDRIGVRLIGTIGVALYCVLFACLAFAGPSIWTWWAMWLLLGCAGMAIKPTVWTTAVSSLFSTSRGLALSVMLCGTGLGSSLTPKVGIYLIEAVGWRRGIIGLAAFWAILVIPPVYLFLTSAKDQQIKARVGALPHSAPEVPALTGVALREGLLSWRYARLALAGFLTSLVIVSFVSSLIPILSDRGFTRDTAANIAALAGISTMVGRLVGGYMLDRTNGNVVGAISVGLAIVPSLLFWLFPGSLAISSLGGIVLGLILGAELDAVAFLTSRHFGMRHFGVLFGTISGLLALSTGLGPLFVSLIYDHTRSYDLVLIAYIPMCLLAAGLFLSLGQYPQFQTSAEAL